MYGRNKHQYAQEKKKQETEQEMQTDHPIPRKRRRVIQGSKKKGCPARVFLKEVIRFPHFQATSASKRAKDDASWALRHAVATGMAVMTERRIYMTLPSDEKHAGTHPTGTLTGFFNTINVSVRNKLEELVGHGVTTVSEARRHLKVYVETVLFPNPKSRPVSSDTAYYPTDRVIRNHIYAARMKLRYAKLDQENLQKQVEEWRTQNPRDKYKLVLATSEPTAETTAQDVEQSLNADDMNDEDEVLPIPKKEEKATFFFCHQTEYQRHLLQRYGNTLCLLDATYKTTRYELPMFFLAVKTNFGYSVAGQFVVQFETVAAIQEGLRTIQQWMMEDERPWTPRYFMTVFSEREIRAIEETFPGCHVFLCDFHREQSWVRWVAKSCNCVPAACKENLLSMLHKCAHAVTPADYERALESLKTSQIWMDNKRLQTWFSKQWIPHSRRWVWAYRNNEGIQVNTNNGLEAQNKVFKYAFLEKRKDASVCGMLHCLLTEYLPAMMQKYIKENVSAMGCLGRSYSEAIPEYLKDRPAGFIKHCMKKVEMANTLEKDDVLKISDNHYQVKSEVFSKKKMYDVYLKTESGLPRCACMDWSWSQLPCKHMFAVLLHGQGANWLQLREMFRESPFFTLDKEVTSYIGMTLEPDVHHEVPPVDSQCSLEPLEGWVGRKSATKRIALRCREKLDLIKDMSYMCDNVAILQYADDHLTALVMTLQDMMNTDEGLVPTPVVHSVRFKRKITQSQSKRVKAARDLPLRKKKSQRRVGMAADRAKVNRKIATTIAFVEEEK
ncbi:uncharacterized protein [Diadema setosum]|uniref:uncharacterized protein n=1 Tax=Diadema setosum TaxID=31175 RepID=UPI003B3A8C2F